MEEFPIPEFELRGVGDVREHVFAGIVESRTTVSED